MPKYTTEFHRLPTSTLQGSNISPKNGILKMIFLFPRWDMFPGGYILYLYFRSKKDFEIPTFR